VIASEASPANRRKRPASLAGRFADSRLEPDQAAAAAAVFTSDLLSRLIAASRSIRSMAATSRAMRSTACS